jgi:hypothetical protein
VFPPKLFTFHLEVQTTGGNVVHVSVGNMCKRKKEKEPQVCLSAPPPPALFRSYVMPTAEAEKSETPRERLGL